MRRIMSACLCVALMLCLSACGADKNFVISPFSSNVAFTMGDVSVKGTLNFETKDNLTFTVKEPDYISGVTFSRNEVSVDDIKIPYGKVSDYSPVKLLLDVIADVSQRELTISLKGEFTYSGETSSAGYKIIFDCENEKITSIEAGKYTYNFE